MDFRDASVYLKGDDLAGRKEDGVEWRLRVQL